MDMDLRANTKLKNDTYQVVSVLGRGGFGITYKAITHGAVTGVLGGVKVDIPVTIKEFFMKDSCVREEDTQRVSIPTVNGKEQIERYKKKFIKEAYNLSKLDHPNIVKVIDVFEENNTVYYVMQFLKNGTLTQYIRENGKMNEEMARKYILQIADALDYMHTKMHMCHYDVKPSNILLDDHFNAKLIDFGISKNYDEGGNATSSTPVGISKGYAPLEQYRHSINEFSPASDVYSLGATLYTLLTGKVPPEASDVLDNGLPPCPGDVSPKIWHVVEKAMTPRRKDRPQQVSEIVALLRDEVTPVVMDDVETQLFEDDEPEEKVVVNAAEKTASSPKLMKMLMGVLLAFLCVGGAFYAWKTMDGSSDGAATQDVASRQAEEVEMDYTLKGEKGNADVKFHYRGQVVGGVPQGKGIGEYAEGVYEGHYRDGKREDKHSVMKMSNGDVYEGSWENDFYSHGRYTLHENGMYFEGEYRQGEPYNGIYYKQDGSVYYYVKNGEEIE